MYTFVIPDLHGRFDLLEKALKKLKPSEKETVVFLGDYIDRGPDSKAIVNMLINSPDNWITLKGNHEDMAVSCKKDPYLTGWWYQNGGEETVKSYIRNGYVDEESLQYHTDWFETLPEYYEDKHRVYVHASVFDGRSLENQTQEDLLWSRYPKGYDYGWRDKHVVHGHTPVPEPECLVNRTNLDTGAVFTGKLSIGVFEDSEKGGPKEIITVGAAWKEAT